MDEERNGIAEPIEASALDATETEPEPETGDGLDCKNPTEGGTAENGIALVSMMTGLPAPEPKRLSTRYIYLL